MGKYRYCPQCKAEYKFDILECSDCHVSLVDTLSPEAEPDLMAKEHVEGEFVRLAVFNNVNQGYMVKSILQGQGIHCVTQGDDMTGVLPLI